MPLFTNRLEGVFSELRANLLWLGLISYGVLVMNGTTVGNRCLMKGGETSGQARDP